MGWIQRNWTLFSILTLGFCAAWMAFSPPPPGTVTGGRAPAPREGFLAPDFALQDASGQTVRLSDLRGKPVLLNLWASWCPPCKAEMPAMQLVHEAYSEQGFTILAVNTTYQDDRASALEFIASRGLTFPVLFDVDGSVSRRYLVRSMPTSFFIDSEGIIRRVVIGGPMSEALLRAEAERLLEGGR
jgi:peroxiredoxin